METKNQNNKSIIHKSNFVAQPQKKSNRSVGSNRKTNKNLKPVSKTRIVIMKKKDKSPFPVTIVFSVIVITILFLFMIMNFAEIDRYNADIADLKADIAGLQTEAIKIEQRLNSKNNMMEIDQFAKENGMVKTTDVERINITSERTNEGTVIKYNDGDKNGLGVLLSGFSETLKKFFQK